MAGLPRRGGKLVTRVSSSAQRSGLVGPREEFISAKRNWKKKPSRPNLALGVLVSRTEKQSPAVKATPSVVLCFRGLICEHGASRGLESSLQASPQQSLHACLVESRQGSVLCQLAEQRPQFLLNLCCAPFSIRASKKGQRREKRAESGSFRFCNLNPGGISSLLLLPVGQK